MNLRTRFALVPLFALLCGCGSVPPRPDEPTGSFEIRLASRHFTPTPTPPEWDRLLGQGDGPVVRILIQFERIPDAETRALLDEAGIELGQPVSGRAYVAAVRRTLDRSAPSLAAIRWAGPFRTEDKLSPALARGGTTWARRSPGRMEVVVTLFPETDFAAAVRTAEQLGCTVIGMAPAARIFTASVPTGREVTLAAIDAVRFIEPTVPPGTGESDRARGLIGAHVGAIPAGRPNGQGVIVGVFDAVHVRQSHPDFGTRARQGDGGTRIEDQHATMTAGMIAGSGARSTVTDPLFPGEPAATTANQWRGVAPAAELRSYNFFNGTDSITDFINDVTDAVQNDDVAILNNSWGDSACADIPYGSYEGRAPFLDGVVGGALGRRVAVVFSAGNNRSGFGYPPDLSCVAHSTAPFENYRTVNHPKAAKNVIVVGAIDSANRAMTAYSSWGPTVDGRIKPEVVAAGHHNGTMVSSVSSLDNVFGNPVGSANQQGYRVPGFDPPPDDSRVYAWFTQTSSAAAEVSGGLALMIDGWRRAFPGRADPLPSTLRAATVHEAIDLDDATTWFNRGPDFASGFGLVQVNESVAALERGDALEGSVAHLGEAHYFVDVAGGSGPLKVTLAWDDAPAIDGADPALVNDLDLVVTDPGGVRHFPWTLDPAAPATAAVRTAEDHVNNLEQVVVDAPAAGTWSVTVRGTTVATEGRQSFSIMSRGGFTRQPVDLILALDTSSSMNEEASPGGLSKIDVLRRSVRLLLETWTLHAIPGDRIGVVTFSSNVATAPAEGPVLRPFLANVASVTAATAGLQAQGCTALGGALQVSLSSFDPASTSKRTVLVVTDGMQSANPFVGEGGAGSRLRIATFPGGSPLPLDAFFCTLSTASGPDGSVIVPDGVDIADHGAEIHSIGIGVNGAGFQELIARLASENGGLQHLTVTPDADLDILYVNDLVRALKSNTLEIVKTDAAVLAPGEARAIEIPVDASSRSVTAVLSWKGSNQIGAIDARMHGPDGSALTPDRIRQEAYFTLLKFDLPAAGGARPGVWRLALRRPGSPAVTYQLSVIADETCLHYDFAAGAGPARAGDAVPLRARVKEAGAPAQRPLQVRVRLSAPSESLGNLLAAWVPKTSAAQEYLAAVGGVGERSPPPVGPVLEAALAELGQNRAFIERATARESSTIQLELGSRKDGLRFAAGMGWFAARTHPLVRTGAHRLTWEIEGKGACGGPVRREERGDLVVGLGPIDRAKSVVGVSAGRGGTSILRLRPVDRAGNLLGPGMASSIRIESKGLKAITPVVDLLDGAYVQTFSTSPVHADAARITIAGETWIVPAAPEQRPR